MILRFSNWLIKVSTARVALVGLVVFLLFTALVLPAQAQKAEASSQGAGSPDQSFLYSPEDLYQMAEAYGAQGRADYIQARFSFDLIWPVVYAFFLATSISFVCARTFSRDSLWQQANLVPALALLFDYLENLSSSLVMLRFPAQTAIVDWLAPAFTLIKWVLVGGSFGLLIAGIGVAAWLGRKRSANQNGGS